MYLRDHPALLLPFAFASLWLATGVGIWLARRRPLEMAHDEFDVIQTATLTLLGLIIGFSFSMAISRYDLRKNLEQAETNAISTEYARAELLPAESKSEVRTQLRSYLRLRIEAHLSNDEGRTGENEAKATELERRLWTEVRAVAVSNPTPTIALVVSGMNAVFDAAGDSTAARLNRIPDAAWYLMALIAVCCCVLIGYGAINARRRGALLAILPLVLSVSFFLIADIDTPAGGAIRVEPTNLQRLVALLEAQ